MADEIRSTPLRVLILDDEATIRTTLTLCLEAAGHQVAAFGTRQPALDASGNQVFDLLFLDIRLGIENGLDLMPRFQKQSPWMKIIVITAYASIDTAVEAMRRGAVDYLPKPFTPEHVEMLAAKVAEARALEFRLRDLVERMDAASPPVTLASENRQVRTTLELAKTFAASRAAILIQGEDGTGKRTLARAIHEWSPRRLAPFMICSAQGRDERTLGLELFGGESREAGAEAATGGHRSRLEYCAAGGGGTLYLEDLWALPPRLQLKLVEFVQAGSFEREETFERVVADVRIIAGTSGAPLVERGLLRPDLYYAFSAKAVELPPLRERLEDFAALAQLFAVFYCRHNGRPLRVLSADALAYLRAYAWPGNLRELRNVIERAVLLGGNAAEKGEIGIEHCPPNLRAKDSTARLGDLLPLEAIEETHIRSVLATTQSLESAAKILGIDYATLWRRRKKYGL